MPIYEYACESCGERFEQLVRSMTAEPKICCPKCSSDKASRSLSVFAVNGESSKSSGGDAPGCGRCGGPGPCASGY